MEVNVLIHKPLGALRPVHPIAAKEKDKHTNSHAHAHTGCEVCSWLLGTTQGHCFRPFGPLNFETLTGKTLYKVAMCS